MLVEVKRHGSWRCLCNPRQLEWVTRLPSIPALLDLLKDLPVTLKDNHRSRVVSGELLSRRIVAKQPHNKNKRLWARLLTYFESCEAAQTLIALERFHELGIPSVQPLFVLEYNLGVVVDSWVCYQYREGTACTEECLPNVIKLLKKMHQFGFRHNDPNLGNFLVDATGEMFLLDSKGRARTGDFSDANDFFLLKKLNKSLIHFQVSDVEHLDQRSLGYRLAKLYTKLKSVRSAVKDKIKKNRAKNTDE